MGISISVPCVASRIFAFAPDRTAFLAIDMQNDFLSESGMAGVLGEDVGQLRGIVPTLRSLLAAIRRAGIRVIHTREGYAPDLSDASRLKRERENVGRPGPLGRFLIRGERGHDFIHELRPLPGERVVDKPGFDAFFRTDLDAYLRDAGVTHLMLAGVTTQCCVHSTLRGAVDRGYYCLTVADCCAAYDPALHEAALGLIQGENHLFGWIANARDLTDALAAAAVGALAK
jgi:nicotinamidase-related amidase